MTHVAINVTTKTWLYGGRNSVSIIGTDTTCGGLVPYKNCKVRGKRCDVISVKQLIQR